MKVLFVHQNFPAQFRHIATALAADPANQVVAIGTSTATPLDRVRLLKYNFQLRDIEYTHPFARTFDVECRRAEQIMYTGIELINTGFTPDVVVAHCGWGESLPLRTLFPQAKIIVYCEMFYRPQGQDVNFDPEDRVFGLDNVVGLQARNASSLLALSDCDLALSPTHWQRGTYPAEFQHKIRVCHDGIDIDRAIPDPAAHLVLPDGTILRKGDEVVTFVSRNLEPLRGYHMFMRALARVLRERKSARVVIVGGDHVSYGAHPPAGTTWKQVYLDEMGGQLDLTRIHFLGRVDYAQYLRVLQVSAAHVYLTYPFVLSWSLLEAMAAGCAVVASATAPVEEVVTGENGLLVSFFDTEALSRAIVDVLRDPHRFGPMRLRARQTILRDYTKNRCVDGLLRLIA